jgi:hypothetical protein|tara:strand:+ start:13464 stop:13901 length:438 start_codon:yes stop_codon:yes gene_type:complete
MNKLPEDLINKITDYISPSEFLNFKCTSKENYRICDNKKHIILYKYYDFENFFTIEDKTKLLNIETWSDIINQTLFMRWLNYIVYTRDHITSQNIYNMVWKTIVSPYYIKNFCPTRYDHKSIVAQIRQFRDLIFEKRFKQYQKGI